MPRERCLINMLLRVVALLFRAGGPLRIDGLAGLEPRRPGPVDAGRSPNNAPIFA
jgi:hypothetical protein